MKLIFAVALAASAILLLVETEGAPSQIASEEVGKVVQELRGLLAKSMAAEKDVQNAGVHRDTMTIAQRFPSSQHFSNAQRFRGLPLANAQRFRGLPLANAQRFPSSQHLSDAQYSPYAQGKLQQSSEVTAQVSGVMIEECGEPFTSIINSAFGVLNFFFGSQFGVLVNCGISSNCVQVQVDVPANNVLTDIDVCQNPSNGGVCVQVYVEPTSACTTPPITIPIPVPGFGQVSIAIAVDVIGPPCATVRVLTGMQNECPPGVSG